MFVHGGAFDGFRYKNHVSILRNYESDFSFGLMSQHVKSGIKSFQKSLWNPDKNTYACTSAVFSSPPEMKHRVIVFIAILFFVAVYIWWTKTHILLRWWCTFTVLLIARHFTFKSTNNSNYRYYICHFKKCQISAFSIPL